jgi:hypothetical protein
MVSTCGWQSWKVSLIRERKLNKLDIIKWFVKDVSITNYFGKPRTKYMPYKSPYTFEDLPNDYGDKNVDICCSDFSRKLINIPGLGEEMTILIDHGPKRPSCFPQYNRDTYEIRYDMNTYKLENVQRMFNNVLIKCMEWVAIPFWSISKIVPTVNIFQILVLHLLQFRTTIVL